MVDYLVSSIAILTASFALFSLGLNLQWGFTGLVNFGHVAFMTLGAYTTVLLSQAGVPLVLAVLAGMLMAALLGLLIGFSTLRLREDYLAIVTIGMSEVVRLIALNEEQLTNGTRGVYGYPLPLENFEPNLPLKCGMALILAGIASVGLWRVWQWMIGQQRAPIVRSHRRQWLGFLGLALSVAMAIAIYWFSFTLFWGYLILLVIPGLYGCLSVYTQLQQPLKGLLQKEVPLWGVLAGTTLILGLVGIVIYAGILSILFDYGYKTGLMWLLLVTLAFVFWRLERLTASPWGRVLKAIREDEEVVKALGKDVFRYKLQSFMLGGAIAGLAGSFFAWNLTFINPDGFIPLVTFQAWIMVVLGGSGNNVGTLLGAGIFWAYDSLTRFVLPALFSFNSDQEGAFRIMVIGLLLIILMMWRPQGILGKKEELTLGR